MRKIMYLTTKRLLLAAVCCSSFLYSQTGINETNVNSEVAFQSGSTSKVWILPEVSTTNIGNLTNPQEGMLVIDNNLGGLVGYHKLFDTTAHWSNLFLTEDIIIPNNTTSTLASYTRTRPSTAAGFNKEYTISSLTTSVTTTYGDQEFIATLDLNASLLANVLEV